METVEKAERSREIRKTPRRKAAAIRCPPLRRLFAPERDILSGDPYTAQGMRGCRRTKRKEKLC